MIRGLLVCLEFVYIASASPSATIPGGASPSAPIPGGWIVGGPDDAEFIYKYSSGYTRIWDPERTGTRSGDTADFSIWSVDPQEGYCSLGDVAISSYEEPTAQAILVKQKYGVTAKPVSFTRRYIDAGNGIDQYLSVWKMNPPGGYRCLGDAAVGGKTAATYDIHPKKNLYCCVKEYTGNIPNIIPGYNELIYHDKHTGANQYLSVFGVKRRDGTGIEGPNFVTCKDNTKWCDADEVENGYLLNGVSPNLFFQQDNIPTK